MGKEEEFLEALDGKKVPILVLDQKWHRLFAIHGKPDDVKEMEKKLNALLARQGKINTEVKEMKAQKARLMESIMDNMDDQDAEIAKVRDKNLEDSRKLIDEINARSESYEEELLELPELLRATNQELMLLSMQYFYDKYRINQEEADEIEEWIAGIRVELKKNIIRKQNRDINNREMYAYLHDIFGHEVIDLFDFHYDQMNKQEVEE